MLKKNDGKMLKSRILRKIGQTAPKLQKNLIKVDKKLSMDKIENYEKKI